MRTATVNTLILAASLGLAACGGHKDGDAATADGATSVATKGADLDPCSLMTADEMTAITTDKVDRLDRRDASCTYHSEPDDGTQVTVVASGGADKMRIVRKSAELLGGMGAAVADKGGVGADAAAAMSSGTDAPPKLGDEAAWEANTTLAVRKGDAFVEVTPPIMHDMATHKGMPIIAVEEKRKIATAVAEKLLAKLGG